MNRFAPDAVGVPPRVVREDVPDAPGGFDQNIRVFFGEVLVVLDRNGNLKTFANMSAGALQPLTGGDDFFASDNLAWTSVRSLCAFVGAATDLQSDQLERGTQYDRPNVLRLRLRARPYGREQEGGNQLVAEIHRVTGKVITLYVVRGWHYEQANGTVTTSEAVAAARHAYGGTAEEWTAREAYESIASSSAPLYCRQMRANKTMRLHFIVSSSYGTAYVDTTTGDIVDFIAPTTGGGRAAASSTLKEGQVAKSSTSSPAAAVGGGVGPRHGSGAPAGGAAIPIEWAFASVAAIAAVLLAIRARHATRGTRIGE